MKKTEFKKKSYEAPEIEVIYIQNESFICSSITHNASHSTEEEWEADEETEEDIIILQ
ncbi:MAG: hypothetical protein PUH24_09995 [Prevotellaceae bacterium]|nr:hypothetical protein [Prevotellaceae bacterium]MDY6131475.1 hypothetical protein [Prevotella sp.]